MTDIKVTMNFFNEVIPWTLIESSGEYEAGTQGYIVKDIKMDMENPMHWINIRVPWFKLKHHADRWADDRC